MWDFADDVDVVGVCQHNMRKYQSVDMCTFIQVTVVRVGMSEGIHPIMNDQLTTTGVCLGVLGDTHETLNCFRGGYRKN